MAVQFLYPDTAWGNDQFRIEVRDAKDSSRAPDSTLWTGVYCQADSAQMTILMIPPLNKRTEKWCSPYGYDPARPYPMVLVTRDSLGALSWLVDTIALRPGSAPQPPRERRRD